MKFIHTLRVYYDATDAGGVVYHAQYLNFIEHARMEYFLHHGIDPAALHEKHNQSMVVVNANLTWRLPARVGDVLDVTMSVIKVNRTSVIFHHEISKKDDSDNRVVLVEADVKLMFVSLEPMKVVSMPEEIRALLINNLDK